ncbi:hypothetical protein C8F01DRAFT_1326616 [Mycena amicta]|nr:hypothetical protein C8F01DRAFT_1326616 [Mycena amicta]
MRFSTLATAASLVSIAAAADILVKVGDNQTLTFNPSSVTAAVGDVISFQFLSKNHSVTQSTFANPCAIQTTPTQGIDSGFQFVAANATSVPEWSFTVNNATAPIWFFCAQTNPVVHCNKGMVFAVNAPATGKTFDAFQAAALGGGASSAAGSSTGGAAPSGTPAPSSALINRASAAGFVAVAAGLVAGLLL